jgi:hypothetical protein
MRRRHIQHGPRRRWFAPWTKVCQCGLGSWPCYAVRMLEAQARMQPRPPANTAGPAWAGPTRQLATLGSFGTGPDRPLLTRGQAERANGRPR